MKCVKAAVIILAVIFSITQLNAISPMAKDSIEDVDTYMKKASIKSVEEAIVINIRNVDISQFPEINVIVEAYNKYGEPIDTLLIENMHVLENNVEKKILSVKKISVKERVPVDFVFIIDKTGSMQSHIDAVRNNITEFTTSLIRRGIDYRIGLILFTDDVEEVYQPTEKVKDFLDWLAPVRAIGGRDEKENALEAILRAISLTYRPAADKVIVLITDAPYHQIGEDGHGITGQTTKSIINLMKMNDFRVFSIVPKKLREYADISGLTKGNIYDIEFPVEKILDNFSNQLTNLYALRYRSDEAAIPDSINIALLDDKKELVRKTIPIVELGRKLIIENLLFQTSSAALPDSVPELNVLTQFLINRPNVAIVVEGHTDSRGSAEFNNYLSVKRAESVKNYLVKHGINSHRIKTMGYGESRPIADNNTDFGRQLNRRTEIIIVAK
jgi:outer membrane protein OmpA-like peptidoglycan-associated protein/Mg-chelatase subunit ChlD